ncbi:unnamed protein product [Adineta steineri]|uniref:NAD(P)(+)--arginine ADP-ribosyltransferase n=1 Tax=Adineta steineri TaxID=433720 RepID=A0A815SMT2_9BILA|nr:unnamed protein product [Adineta steineri]CAF1494775.1 unnamed protein product [Adineta steineri]
MEQNQNYETYSLIWLDQSVNNSSENIQAQEQLRTLINHLVTFENEHDCFHYIRSIDKGDRVVLIVSGHLGSVIVPKLIGLRQLASIYVYCKNKKNNQLWANQFNKVKAVVTRLDELIELIRNDKTNEKDEHLPLSILHANNGDKQRSTSDLNGDFLHFQILIDCLMKMKYYDNDKNELITLCKQQYKRNPNELKKINEFEKGYKSEHALWWYTRDSFLYKMLNKALRVQNIHLLYLFRFLIRHIGKQLTKNRCQTSIRVYRAQLMTNNEIEMMQNSLGEFISINSFFSTSFNYDKAREFFLKTDNLNEYKRVCFVIDADPTIENVNAFGDISRVSFYPGEREVLFMIGSIFRLVKIRYDEYGILIIKMKLFSMNDQSLKELYQHMQKRGKNGETNLLDFADALTDMSKWDDAQRYYEKYLDEVSSTKIDIDKCYAGLGNVAYERGDLDSSLKWHYKALKIRNQTFKADSQCIGESYNSIANAYQKKKAFPNALESYETALKIFRRIFGNEHIYVATCMNNMGNTYMGMNMYQDALQYYENASVILKKNLPADHVNIGSTYKNIGNVLSSLGHYEQALSYLNSSLEIYKKSRPSLHPSIGSVLRYIGLIYQTIKDYRQALSYFEKAAVIFHHSYPPTHPDVIEIDKNLRQIASKLK